MDGGLAVGTLPTSLGAGTEVRAATSKRRVVAVLLGACIIAYTFLVPSLATSTVGWALQAAVRASVPQGAKAVAAPMVLPNPNKPNRFMEPMMNDDVEPAKGNQKPAEEPKAAAPAAKAQAEKRDWWEAPDVSKMDDPWSKRKVATVHDNSV
jgi:hypothetical protein